VLNLLQSFFGILALIALTGAAQGQMPATPAPQPPRTAVVSAFAAEQDALRAALTDAATVTLGGVEYHAGRLDGVDVLLFVSGESMVNATMNTQRALDHFPVTRIVMVGIAGALDPALDVGDVVVAERWAQHQQSVYLRQDADGAVEFPDFLDAGLPACGMIAPQPVRLTDGTRTLYFDAAPDLLDALRAAAPDVQIGGAGVSGQAYVNNADYGACLFASYGARIVDMESAAVAQVAAANGLDFVAVRALSDRVGAPYAQPVQMLEQDAAITGGMLAAQDAVRALLRHLAQSADD
jgi:adenosylhomocysteine nucleosidase